MAWACSPGVSRAASSARFALPPPHSHCALPHPAPRSTTSSSAGEPPGVFSRRDSPRMRTSASCCWKPGRTRATSFAPRPRSRRSPAFFPTSTGASELTWRIPRATWRGVLLEHTAPRAPSEPELECARACFPCPAERPWGGPPRSPPICTCAATQPRATPGPLDRAARDGETYISSPTSSVRNLTASATRAPSIVSGSEARAVRRPRRPSRRRAPRRIFFSTRGRGSWAPSTIITAPRTTARHSRRSPSETVDGATPRGRISPRMSSRDRI